MTREELVEILNKYPSNVNIQVAVYRMLSDIESVDKIVDMDTGVVSVCLYGTRELPNWKGGVKI